MNPAFEQIGQAFVAQYYALFDSPSERPKLAQLYRPDSMLTFEGTPLQGTDAIVAKLTGLPFSRIAHVVTTVDCEPTVDGGVLVVVVGQLKTDDDPPHAFCQTFYLKCSGPAWFIANEFFRLSLHHG